jgi:hypothetical protein
MNLDHNSLNLKSTKIIPVPKLFSPYAIYLFAGFFTNIYGSVLMYINLKTLNKSKEGKKILLLGVLYTIICIIIMGIISWIFEIRHLSSFNILTNIIGILILDQFFYSKHVPEKYKKRKIGFIFFISLLVFIFGLSSLLYLIMSNSHGN